MKVTIDALCRLHEENIRNRRRTSARNLHNKLGNLSDSEKVQTKGVAECVLGIGGVVVSLTILEAWHEGTKIARL